MSECFTCGRRSGPLGRLIAWIASGRLLPDIPLVPRAIARRFGWRRTLLVTGTYRSITGRRFWVGWPGKRSPFTRQRIGTFELGLFGRGAFVTIVRIADLRDVATVADI